MDTEKKVQFVALTKEEIDAMIQQAALAGAQVASDAMMIGQRKREKYYNSIKERLTTDHPRMKPESIERKAREAASKYAERQQRYRAETIARSEIAQAYNHGADAFVREAVTAGNLPEMEKEWSTALDGHVCTSCAALEGAKIGMDDEFKTVSGRREITTSIPPLHPRCKCAVKYVRVKNENIQ